eukprot:CAMPEP_0118927148 /NCGR_PEP_ID=MMETSP1169-20130426/4685_1 /TAXON_ID=36882 /ORGANISM="Pyramimonas obovata, Strain CCMP722" /LENGTH=312 /DNA_ID=CAMNT_0006868853 /DNA_START=40 /DNA_END=978 /DNA_ORIENTATION=-
MNSVIRTCVLPSCATGGSRRNRLHTRKPAGGPLLARDVRRTLCRAEKAADKPGHKDIDPDEFFKNMEDGLMQDPAVQSQLQGVREAAQEVARLQAQQRELEQMMQDAQSNEDSARTQRDNTLAQLAAERGAEEDLSTAAMEVQAALKELEEARQMREAAKSGRLPQAGKWSAGDIDEDAEKIESGKAAAIAAAAGTLASSPFFLSAGDVWWPAAGATLASCALFGVTYRYAVRSDRGNQQLKTGVVGAFGLARGLAQGQTLVALQGLSMETVLQGALLTGESMMTFAFAFAAMEAAFQSGNLKPFGTAGKEQ